MAEKWYKLGLGIFEQIVEVTEFKLAVFTVLVFAFVFSASAIDINSSTALQYFSDSNLNFEVGPNGKVEMPGKANFTSTGIEFGQPLSIESSGPLSVANGIQLTGTSTNSIESYSTMYLTTSSGSPSDIVLDPTGEVGIDSNLNLGGNNITGIQNMEFTSGLNIDGDLNTTGGSIDTEGGNIELNGGYVSNDGDDEGISVDNSGNVEIPNGYWINEHNSNFGAEWFDTGSDAYKGLDVSPSGRNFRLGSTESSSASNQHQMVFSHNNVNSETTFGITTSSDGGDTWYPTFEVKGNGKVEIPNNALQVNGTKGVTFQNPNWGIEKGDLTAGYTAIKGYNGIELYDTQNNQRILQAHSGGNVEIPNGNIRVKNPSNTGEAVNVGGNIQSDGNVKTYSGNVGSDSRMCIGDRCA